MNDHSLSIGGVDVSRETMEKLRAYSDLIVKWTKTINLISPASVPDIWDRHITDSAQIYQYAPSSWGHWIDLGSGGGLPGLVISILDQSERPVTLIESDTRKCLFLNTVRRELDLNVTVLNKRINAVDTPPADVITARALAPLTDLMTFASDLLLPTGTALFSKGLTYKEEVDAALENWQFEYEAHASHTNPDACVLEISRIQRRES
ncbi:16S rRNA (guanine(527)-N(7))-methyltransferase RsmG [Octadecabacter sp. G9-8]|uniref:Ribosomal RNA small subunit methyltransferase G n=1 Tax=Octadecabacter dasysiphoniae TaxID=2909341 RepID=A0ABS9CW62_9RHOB|nr:16S rRNA (guanine(527)-N(7))-methyltransferase RsmG [Octadecabacter dasysiphoniae]MCF2871480.1 16S rRNA (guanine(527)-N(7))-methyltransferase RsmG [Octadecabacter dasysiphoniae]